MAAYFLDSSALVKRYVDEVGSAWVNALIHPRARNSIHIARITGVEVVSALARRQRAGTLTVADLGVVLARFRYEFDMGFQLVALTPRLLAAAMALAETHSLRGYDAVQLAGGIQVNARQVDGAARASRWCAPTRP